MLDSGSWKNFSHQRGHWYRLTIELDFAADGGEGTASATISDLTTGGSAAAIDTLTSNPLGLGNQGIDRADWRRMEVTAVNVQLDNLCLAAE